MMRIRLRMLCGEETHPHVAEWFFSRCGVLSAVHSFTGEVVGLAWNLCQPSNQTERGIHHGLQHVDFFCALVLNVIRARYWSRSFPPPGTRRELGETTEKETHKTYQCKCWTKERQSCTEFFEPHRTRVSHEVHALFWGGIHRLKMYVTTMTISDVYQMFETVFPNLAMARAH